MRALRVIEQATNGFLSNHALPFRENRENAAKAVGETVQFFITTMDSLKLNMVAVDQLYPLLNDLMQSLNKVCSKLAQRI